MNMEYLQSIFSMLILAILCGTAAWLIKNNKQRLMVQVESMIQKAENAVQGSGMGAEKKKIVIAQLEAAGVTVTSWLSDQIDTIVAALNSKGAWLAEQVQQNAASLSGTTEASNNE